MHKRALSILSLGGGDSDSKPKTALSSHIIDHHEFIDSVVGGHSYDYSDEAKCNVEYLHGIVNYILSDAMQLVVTRGNVPQRDFTEAPEINMPSNNSHLIELIEWIHCQMTCQARQGENMEDMWRTIFQKLRSYRWTTQVLLVLAAFSLQYGDFWYAFEAPPDSRNALSGHLSKALSSLKKKVISDVNKAAIIPLNDVVNCLCELTTSLVHLTKLVNQHRGKHLPELAKAFQSIPRWSCETIIAILAAGNIFAQITGVRTVFSESELGNLKSSMLDRSKAVRKAVTACEEQIGSMEKYQNYVKKVEAPVDIADFLRSLLVDDSKQNPFATDSSNKLVEFELFRKKNVLLIISDQKISKFDIATLESIKSPKGDAVPVLTEETDYDYELVWIPIVDAGQDKLEALQSFQSVREWAFVVDPRKMNEFARRYIKEEWRFKRETMAVVLDSLGWVENTDAMPMLRIWGKRAFPCTGNESSRVWRGLRSWVQLILSELVKDGTSDVVKDEHILFWGGPPAVEVAGDASKEIPNLREVPIEDMKRFRVFLRSCLITRLQALQIQKEGNPLRDRMLYETSEAYNACQSGGVAILTRRSDWRVRHVGLASDLKLVRDQAKDGWTDLAKGFEKKYEDTQGRSVCLHVRFPHYTDLEDLYCPVCGRLIRYDLCISCCHTNSD